MNKIKSKGKGANKENKCIVVEGVEVKPAMLINAGISIKKLQLLLILEFLITL